MRSNRRKAFSPSPTPPHFDWQMPLSGLTRNAHARPSHHAIRSTISLLALSLALVAGQRAAHAQAVSVTSGATVAVPGPLFPASSYSTTASGLAGVGFFAQNAGSTINGTGVSITTSGADAQGIRVLGLGLVTMAGGSITTLDTTGTATTASHGVMAQGASTTARVELRGTSVSTVGPFAVGLRAVTNAIALADAVTVHTTGDNGFGIQALSGAQITVQNGSLITTEGTTGRGVSANSSGTSNSRITINDSRVVTQGGTASGLLAQSTTSTATGFITATNTSVETFGDGSTGASAGFFGSTITLNGGSVTTHGAGSQGLLAQDNALIAATGTTITTTGANAHGATASASSVPTFVNLTNASVVTSGTGSRGLYASTTGVVNATGTSVTTNGANAPGLFTDNAGTINFSNQSITTTAASAPGISFGSNAVGTFNTVTLTNATVNAAGNAMLAAAGRNVLNLNASTLNTQSGLALNVTSSTGTAVNADASTINGAAFTAAGSISNVTLQNDTVWNMTGTSNVTSLVNDTSLVAFSPPFGDPALLSSYKTLTVVNYTGAGGTLGLNTFLGNDASPSDRLIINGGSATGDSLLRITNQTGPGALTTGNGILVVSAVNGGTTASGAFALGNIVAAGAYEYLLFRGGVTPGSDQNWFLRSQLVPPPPPPPPPPGPPPSPPSPPSPPPPPPPPTPLFRPEAALYASLPAVARASTLATLDTFHERQGEQFLLRGNSNFSAAWGRVFGQHTDQRFDGPFQQEFNGTITGFQGGVDLLGWEKGLHRDRAGLFAAFTQADMDVRGFAIAVPRAPVGSINLDSTSVGAYWTHIGPAAWYIDTILMGTFFDSNARSIRGQFGISPDGTGITASVESGVPIWFGPAWTIEPQVQLIFQHVDFDDAADPFSRVLFHTDDAVTGRVGLRITNTFQWLGATIQPYLRANLWHQFSGTDVTQFNLASFGTPLESTSVEVGGGVVASVNAALGLFATGSYVTDVGGVHQETFKGRVGMRYTW